MVVVVVEGVVVVSIKLVGIDEIVEFVLLLFDSHFSVMIFVRCVNFESIS